MKKSELTKLYKSGLLAASVFNYFELKDKVQQYKRQGKSPTKAVELTAKITGQSKRTVYRALKATKGTKLD